MEADPRGVPLLLYLLLRGSGGYVRREEVESLFWPGDGGASARLDAEVRFLRRHLGNDAIRVREGEVGVSDAVWCDVIAFERALADGRTEDAMEYFTGDLMPGVSLAEAPAFGDWLDRERSRLRKSAASAATTLANANGQRAVHFARMAVEWSPYAEEPVRVLMDALVAQGDRDGAVVAFEDYRRRLEALETTPGDELSRVAERLAQDRVAGPTPDAATDSGERGLMPELGGGRLGKIVGVLAVVLVLVAGFRACAGG